MKGAWLSLGAMPENEPETGSVASLEDMFCQREIERDAN